MVLLVSSQVQLWWRHSSWLGQEGIVASGLFSRPHLTLTADVTLDLGLLMPLDAALTCVIHCLISGVKKNV